MSYHRIQKLLFSEYCDFEDMVLIESPFAQTTKEGVGLRQIHLGLTPTKLILAVDVLPPADDSQVFCTAETDPEIETFELIAVYPIESVNVSVYRRKKRQTLKVHFCNNRILYLELGGFERRKAFWNLWCERVQFLCPELPPSSKSETSVATSTSNSSLYLVSKRNVNKNGRQQVWCKFGLGEKSEHPSKWMDKYIYLGPEYENSYRSLNLKLRDNFFISDTEITGNSAPDAKNANTKERNVRENKILKVNRFGSGVKEGCSTGLFLVAEESEIPKLYPSESTESIDILAIYHNIPPTLLELSESGVKIWETTNASRRSRRHPRRYGIMPQPYFLYGLGCCSTYEKENIPTQLKQSLSFAKMKCPETDTHLKLSMSKRILTSTMSCEIFHLDRSLDIHTCSSKMLVPDKHALLFWTPEYWRQIKPAYKDYFDFLEYIQKLQSGVKKKPRKKCYRTGNIIYFSRKNKQNPPTATSASFQSKIHQELKMDVALTAWDFDSTTLAYQLVTIDKELFIKIHAMELQVVMWQRSSRNAPNVRALLEFTRRIGCLVTTEILREQSEKARSKLIVKFLNIANKCDSISSYQSCKSILNGLQSPPIYRLQNSWSYIRQRHSMKYQLFKRLCYKYTNPRSAAYRKDFEITHNAPYLPCIGQILARLLDKAVYYSIDISQTEKDNYKFLQINNNNIQKPNESINTFSKFLSTVKAWSEVKPRQAAEGQPEKVEEPVAADPGDSEYLRTNDKRKIIEDVTEFVRTAQKAAAKYVFDRHDLARAYLLKARYRDETANFLHSLNIERCNNI